MLLKKFIYPLLESITLRKIEIKQITFKMILSYFIIYSKPQKLKQNKVNFLFEYKNANLIHDSFM
jgi:hypothetical protein